MDALTLLGLAGAACTTSSFLPQAVKSWKTKKTEDISLGMYALIVVGTFLWLIYGIIKHDIPLMAANSISFVLGGLILYCKIKYSNRPALIKND
ncbi:MAG: lipid-A-disaccharide synthase N-terminal domain-containing protein [Elusimicrobia bacterium]|nr:lipid-A-disaccharide synthase N-terminal domain-containing protein [Elusimicrobiota bacterium]